MGLGRRVNDLCGLFRRRRFARLEFDPREDDEELGAELVRGKTAAASSQRLAAACRAAASTAAPRRDLRGRGCGVFEDRKGEAKATAAFVWLRRGGALELARFGDSLRPSVGARL